METKLKFKVGDRVRVKSLEWYNSNKNVDGDVETNENYLFLGLMAKYCGCDLIIEECKGNFYLTEDNGFIWQDYMFEDEQEKQEIEQPHKVKRVLTKEVAQAVVRCTKYRLKNENESTQLQEKLFEIGCKWLSGCRNVQYTSDRYLFVSSNLNITCSNIKEQYIKDFSQELEVNDVLNITINEIEAEVKEIEETDMETKELKKEEIFAYLRERKIICYGIEEAYWLQEKLFELGCKNLSDNSTNVRDAYLFYINEDLKIVIGEDFSRWVENKCKAIKVSEVMAIELKEEKPKFDPKTLQDFQKVLYRSSNADWWRLGFFDTYNETQDNKFWIIGKDVQPYGQCVPYNEETKHLHGTTEEAPEFYRG